MGGNEAVGGESKLGVIGETRVGASNIIVQERGRVDTGV
jgi:hypothetical protein